MSIFNQSTIYIYLCLINRSFYKSNKKLIDKQVLKGVAS